MILPEERQLGCNRCVIVARGPLLAAPSKKAAEPLSLSNGRDGVLSSAAGASTESSGMMNKAGCCSGSSSKFLRYYGWANSEEKF